MNINLSAIKSVENKLYKNINEISCLRETLEMLLIEAIKMEENNLKIAENLEQIKFNIIKGN